MIVDTIVALEGLSEYRTLEDVPANILKAASRAINRTTERARTAGAREIRKQVNLPARYVSDNLFAGAAASPGNLEREIVGKQRPVSLARFARGTPESTQRVGQVSLEMQTGRVSFIGSKQGGKTRAFLIRLRGRGGDTGANANIGLAVRLKPGETIRNKKFRTVTTNSGLTLLYGASVDQIFQTVREDITPDTADFLEREFLRLIELDLP